MNTINNFKPFQTILGYDLLNEINNFVSPKTCIVTMQDLWIKFKLNLDNFNNVYFVSSLEEKDLEKQINEFSNYDTIIGLGGGQAIDIAKYFSWKCNLRLFQFPTSLSVDAVFGHRSGIRRNNIVNYIGWAIPECVFIDYEIIQQAPKIFNYSGIGDILCFYTGVLDWKYADNINKCENKWKYDQDLAAKSLSYVDELLDNTENIKKINKQGIDTIVKAHQWGGNSFFSSGWNPRHIEGIEHFFFYNLELITKKKFVHGQPVCLGFILGCLLHNKYEKRFIDFFKKLQFDIRPEAMNITWSDIDSTLKSLNDFVIKNELWFGIANNFSYRNDIFFKLKESVENIY
ncbi:MAG: hypothetical protein CFH18_00771 [Alphaproteobacteria bacterium MarineAlpha5_Bin8]|nr:MAG: hypothetical protein CFH17_01004 [Alphaproteobacteria bacterium MarineAlpha5_Bin7]PPR45817.1 MAG: hypothetical protein CFH18_00771 [Alphaproteobacteria bacterium MarineAlpha5_Bin8]PPR54493.1 MAG: hypothetical protein CFH16_00365 [Alphaproteobacteria bacterium MarineAlpha5_Bin6]|tara:strand:- start:1718 stop:2752 length:1035 start_codon:yes stop_codon:yes gene_type:complete